MCRTIRVLMVCGVAILLSGFAFADPADKASPGGSVTGIVNKDGKPVAHAKVMLRVAPVKTKGLAKHPDKHASPATQPTADSSKPTRHDVSAQATTDADGKFTMENVAPGEYIVSAGEKGLGKGKVHVSVTSGESASVSIDLQPPKDKLKKPNKLGL